MSTTLKSLLIAVSKLTGSTWASPVQQAAQLLAQRHIAHLSVVYLRLQERFSDPAVVTSQFERRAFLLFHNRIDFDMMAALNLPVEARSTLIQAAAAESWQLIESRRQFLTRAAA